MFYITIVKTLSNKTQVFFDADRFDHEGIAVGGLQRPGIPQRFSGRGVAFFQRFSALPGEAVIRFAVKAVRGFSGAQRLFGS